MTKNEKEILFKAYEGILKAEVLGIDKDDAKREFKYLIDKLGLKEERYILENSTLCIINEYSVIVKEMFEMIFETFKKYGCLIKYDLDDIYEKYENLKYIMSDDDMEKHTKRINIIKNNLK